MITKDTARRIYNCHQQIEEIDKLKKEMLKEVTKQREYLEKRDNSKPIPESSFGRFGHGMQLGVPDSVGSSMRIYNISPEIGIGVMEAQREALEKELQTLKALASLELVAE